MTNWVAKQWLINISKVRGDIFSGISARIIGGGGGRERPNISKYYIVNGLGIPKKNTCGNDFHIADINHWLFPWLITISRTGQL